MTATFAEVRRQDGITIPTLWIAVAISIVLHALLLITMPELKLDSVLGLDGKEDAKQGSLAVRLAAPPSPPVPPRPTRVPTPPPVPHLTKPAAPAQPAAPPAAAPRVLATERPAPAAIAAPPPTPAPAPAPAAKPPAGGDFAAFVDAKRRQRNAEADAPPPGPPPETEQERHSREVAASLGLNRGSGMGANRSGGGIFQIISINDRNASIAFYGWNRTIERRVLQTIDVSRGTQPTIEMAVVRRMIELIRAQTTTDLTWESIRLKRDVQLSARVADTRELESFLLEEFFAIPRAQR